MTVGIVGVAVRVASLLNGLCTPAAPMMCAVPAVGKKCPRSFLAATAGTRCAMIGASCIPMGEALGADAASGPGFLVSLAEAGFLRQGGLASMLRIKPLGMTILGRAKFHSETK